MPDQQETQAEDYTALYPDILAAMGLDPTQVHTLVMTAETCVAIAADYPEPYTIPEAPDGE